MKAQVLHGIGDIRYEETDKPRIEKGWVLVKVKAAGVCGSDIPRIYKTGAHVHPIVTGHEFSGEVIETADDNFSWRGKRVGIFPLIPCGECINCKKKMYEMCSNYNYLGSWCNGGFAEYAAVPEWNLIELPDNVSYKQAAMMEPMAVAVHAMRRFYIEKDSSINDEIDKLRHSATAALTERKDVIIVASVSCIYGLGSPIDYQNMTVSLRPGMMKDRDEVIKKLVEIQYARNDMDFKRGTFRVRGDVLEIFPVSESDMAFRVEFFGDEVDRITQIDVLTGEIKAELEHMVVFPASHYVVDRDNMNRAIIGIENELEYRVKEFRSQDKLLEAQRISERTNFDIEMLRETGFCSGIENYSRHLSGLKPGQPPHTLLDYFPDDFIIMVDESHITIPQIRGMYAGDRSRKNTLVEYGFRLPSALDNRPLNFDEFESHINQMLFVSATPNVYEKEHELARVEQIIRPTGLLDPEITVKPVKGQIDDLVGEIRKTLAAGNMDMINSLTKKMAEYLTNYLKEIG